MSNKKTRYFVAISGAILAVGLGVGLAASYMGLPVSVFSSAAGPDELQYIPADAAVVAYANVRDVMNSQFRQRFKSLEPSDSQKNEFEEKTGEAPSFFHLNDSEGALGSNKDRHVLIGEGAIGETPFRWLMEDSRSNDVPLILETPQKNYDIADDDPSADPYDVRMMTLLS